MEKRNVKIKQNKEMLDDQFETTLNNAKHYFKYFSADEIKKFWNDFYAILTWYINTVGSQYYITNPLIIISINLIVLSPYEDFKFLMNKWGPKFKNITHPFKSDLPIYWETILGYLYILHNFDNGNMQAVRDMDSLIGANLIQKTRFRKAEKEGVSSNCRTAAKVKRPRKYTKLFETIATEKPIIHVDSLVKRLKKQTNADKKICHIASVKPYKKFKNGFIISYYEKNKLTSVKIKNLSKTLEKIKKRIKNKSS